jgi:hypothetical protein
VPPDRARVLTVAMPTAPSQIDLPRVVKEVSRITGLIQNDFMVQSLAGPMTEEVLSTSLATGRRIFSTLQIAVSSSNDVSPPRPNQCLTH